MALGEIDKKHDEGGPCLGCRGKEQVVAGVRWGYNSASALASRFLLTVGQMQCGASSIGREEVTLIFTGRLHPPLRHPTLPQKQAKSRCSVCQLPGRRGGAGQSRLTFLSVVLYATGVLQEATWSHGKPPTQHAQTTRFLVCSGVWTVPYMHEGL